MYKIGKYSFDETPKLDLAELYGKGIIKGWGGSEIAREHFDVVGDKTPFTLTSDRKGDKRHFPMYQWVRKAIGGDTPNYAQKLGSCVGFMGKNAIEYTECIEIALKGEFEEFKPIFIPYHYMVGKCITGNMCNDPDGSVGIWQAEAIRDYGTLPWGLEGLPEYKDGLEGRWGKKEVTKWFDTGKQHKIGSIAPCRDWETLVTAYENGYVVGVCSDQGFEQEPRDEYGFHGARGNWSHALFIISVTDGVDGIPDHAIILNSWGDFHKRMKDLVNRDVDIPIGCIRAERKVVERMLRQDDSFIYGGGYEGFKKKQIPWELFDVIN